MKQLAAWAGVLALIAAAGPTLADIALAPPASAGGSTPTGTAGSPNAAVLSIQGLSGGTPAPVSGSISITGAGNTATVNGSGGLTVNAVGTAVESGGNLAAINAKVGVLNADNGTQVHVMNVIAGKQQDSGGGDATDPANHAVRVNVVTGAATGVAQGSTTSGQTGGLMQGAVTTAAPAYTTGQTNPLSLTAAGGLRTDGSATTQPVSNSQEHTDLAALQAAVSATAAVKQIDSGGGDATDTVNHAVRYSCVAGCGVSANPRQATASVAINVSATATTQLIAASGTTAIYVSNYSLVASGADNVTLEYGTTCGGTVTALTGAYALAANGGVVAGSGIAPVLIVPAGNALCILHTATTQVGGSVAYAQF